VRVVVVSSCDVVDRYLIGRLRARWPDLQVVRPVTARARPGRVEVLGVVARAPVTSLRRAFYLRRRRRTERRLAVLLPGVVARRDLAATRVDGAHLNQASGVASVAALLPDVLVLSGAPILRDDLLAVPTIGTVNVHLGVAPAYRGEHTLFHALRRRDADGIGVTLHGVDRGIDTGPLLAHVLPAIRPADDEAVLTARCVELVAGVLVDCLEVVERTGRLAGRPQDDRGTLYRRHDRRVVRHDLREFVDRRLLGRRLAGRPSRIVRYDLPAVAQQDPADGGRRGPGRTVRVSGPAGAGQPSLPGSLDRP